MSNKNPSAQTILEYVKAHAKSTVTAVSEELGISRTQVGYHLRALRNAGAVQAEAVSFGTTRIFLYTATTTQAAPLASPRYQHTPGDPIKNPDAMGSTGRAWGIQSSAERL